MATQFEFWLDTEDVNRLFEIKNNQLKKDDMTGNEFAKWLLEKELHRLHPGIVRREDD